jgi:N-(2-amino-2-carboxyethyl)-L-glutamate synthase
MRSALRNTIHNDPFAQIGATPVVKVQLRIGCTLMQVHLKIEAHNPAGSLKDRTAAGLIEDLESRGRLSKSSIIIESTSGNLGVSLAYLSQERGYRFLAVIDPKTTVENCRKMQSFGATLEMVDKPDPTGGYLLERLNRVREVCQQSSRYVWTDQYSNAANPLSHYRTTGPEILAQLKGWVGAVFVAVSTGGTLAGVARFFREVSPQTNIIAVDACGSVVFGGKPAPRKLTGIGSSRQSTFIKPEHYDASVAVADRDAFAVCRQMRAATGISLGGSSGAVLYACARYLTLHPEKENVVCLCPDSGDAYASTIYDDTWMRSNGFDPEETVFDIEAPHAGALVIGAR